MKNRGRLFSAVISLFVFFTVGCVGKTPSDVSAAVGEDSYLFTLNDLNGQAVSLDTLLKQNKAVLVNFWATWCPPCREEIPDLIRLHETHKDRSFTILGVDVGESQKKVSNFVNEFKINYPVVLDSNMKVAERFGIVGIPTSLLIDSRGNVIGQYHAFTRELVADVEKVLA